MTLAIREQERITALLTTIFAEGRKLPVHVLFDVNYVGGEADLVEILIAEGKARHEFSILLSSEDAIAKLESAERQISMYMS